MPIIRLVLTQKPLKWANDDNQSDLPILILHFSDTNYYRHN